MGLKLYKTYQAKAPGSLMIMGEHAVLYGQPAIVAAINKSLIVNLEVHDSLEDYSAVSVISDINHTIEYKSSLNDLKPSKDLEFVLAVIDYFKDELIESNNFYKFTIKSNINSNQGLGSSAAVTAAMVKVIVKFLQQKKEQAKLENDQILEIAKNIVTKVQGGGSGADLAASIFGGVIYYYAEPVKVEVIGDYLPLYIVYSGYKLSTREVIKKIKDNISSSDNISINYKKIFKTIGDLTHKAKSCIENQDWTSLGKLFNQHYLCQAKLELSDNVISDLIGQLQQNENVYGAKISGSGLGDCIIGLINPDIDKSKLVFQNVKNNINGSDSDVLLDVSTEVNEIYREFTKQDVVNNILNKVKLRNITGGTGEAFAPSNIALVKYWGKSNSELNIPYTDSLSISLGNLGATTKISILDDVKAANNVNKDIVILNGQEVAADTDFYLRLKNFLDLFRQFNSDTELFNYYYKIETNINIPVAAGLASSACGFAALVLALNDLFQWNLSKQDLSILARLGSGSASRSLWQGFVYWQKGELSNGMDSYAYKIKDKWPELCIGLLILSSDKKPIGSREAMQITKNTSVLYQKAWVQQVEQDLVLVKQALENTDLQLLGETAENNALSMHATMLSAKPPICYSNQDTINSMHKVWKLREQGVKVYFTQDAGPNLKLIFAATELQELLQEFPDMVIVQ